MSVRCVQAGKGATEAHLLGSFGGGWELHIPDHKD